MSTPQIFRKRIIIISVLIITCVAAAAFFQSIDSDRVYTHLFYIPIILACVWWQRKGVMAALFLGLALLIFHLILQQEASMLNDLLRSIMFFVIAVFVSEISHSEKTKGFLLKKETEKVRDSLKKLTEKEIKLETSYLGLALKNTDLKKKDELIAGKRAKIAELERRIKELKKPQPSS